MGKYSHILLCSDLDGTLLDKEGKMSGENIDAIKYFCAEGGKFCIATGRLPSHLLQFADKDFFKCPIICSNGAAIYDFEKDEVLYSRPLGKKLPDLVDFLEKNSGHVLETTLFVNLEKGMCIGFSESIERIREHINQTVYKIVMRTDSPESAVTLRDRLKVHFGADFNFSRSWDTGVEILDAHATKGDTIGKLKEILGGGYFCICVGDYENDITMIEKADLGCAVANAVPEVKRAAGRVVCSNNESAIKYIVENICGEVK